MGSLSNVLELFNYLHLQFMEGKKAQCQILHHTGSSMQQMNSTFVVCHSGQFWRFFVTHGVGNHVSLGARRGQSIMMHFILVRQHDAEMQHWLGLCHEIDLYIFLQVRVFWFCSFIIFTLYPLFRCKMNKMHNIISYINLPRRIRRVIFDIYLYNILHS